MIKRRIQMSNESQVKILKEVLDLEKYLDNSQNMLYTLENKSFRKSPEPPVRQIVERTYPEIKSTVKFDKVLAFVPSLCFLPWFIIYYFSIYKPQRDADIERIRNSEEYKAEIKFLDYKFDVQQEEFDQQYANEKEEYETETLPNYTRELNEWNEQRRADIETLKNDRRSARKRLNSIYTNTKIVPVQYRTIDALQHIYDVVSTSNFDVTYAISNYDMYRQYSLEQARLQEQRYANQLADKQTALLAEQNEIAERARRDAQIANTIDIIQQHNRNKMLKDMSKKY